MIVTPRAGRDLEAIYDHIAASSPQKAATVVRRILDALEPLKQFPHRTVLSRQSARIAHPVRSLPVPPYLIYFRVLEEEFVVRILTVRHGARRRPQRFD